MHRFIKFGLSLTSVFCLLAGPAWAQEDDSEPTTTITTDDHYHYDGRPLQEHPLFLKGILMALCRHSVGPAL